MPYKPIGDPEATQLSPALSQAVSLGDNQGRHALYMAGRIREAISRLDCLRTAGIIDSLVEWHRQELAWGCNALFVRVRMVQMWAAADPEALPTENIKRRAIIPKIPAFDHLKQALPTIEGYIAEFPEKSEGEFPRGPMAFSLPLPERIATLTRSVTPACRIPTPCGWSTARL